MTRRLPFERPARVVITLLDGSTLVGEAGVNRGDDAAPYSRAELATKFMDLTSRVWPASHAQEVLDLTLALGQGGASLSQWCQLMRVPALGNVAGP